MKTNHSILLLLLLFYSGIIFCQSPGQSKRLQKITINLNEFEVGQKGKINYYSKLLSQQLPFILSVNLKEIGYSVYWTEQLVEQSTPDVKSKYRQAEKGIVKKLLLEGPIRFNIEGEIYVWSNDNIDIKIHLNELNIKKQDYDLIKTLTISVYGIKELYPKLNSIGEDIHRIIQQALETKDSKSIALLCFKIESNEYGGVDSLLSEDYPINFYYDLQSYNFPGVRIVDIDESILECSYEDDQNLNKIATRLKADILVDGKISYINDKGNYRVIPEIYLKEEQHLIIVPGPTKDESDFFELQLSTTDYLTSFFDELINEDGNFNKELIDALTRSSYENTMQFADSLFINGNYPVAAILAYSVIQDEEYNYSARFMLAKCKSKLYEFDEALGLFNKLNNEYPRKAEIQYQRALIYQVKGDYPKSLKELKKVKELDPKYTNLNFQIGFTYYLLGIDSEKNLRYLDKAIKSFKEQVSIDEKNKNAWSMLSLIYYDVAVNSFDYNAQDEFYSKAYSAGVKAMEIQENKDDLFSEDEVRDLVYLILNNHGIDAFNILNYEDALKLFNKMVNIREDEYGLDLIRYCYTKLEDYPHVDLIIEYGIQNNYFTDTVYYFQAEDLRVPESNGSFSQPKLIKALDYLGKYLELNPNNPIALRIVGSTYFRMDSLDNAINYYKQAHIYETDVQGRRDILLNIAELSIMTGHYDEAIESLDKIENSRWSDEDRELSSTHTLQLYLRICALYLLGNDITTLDEELVKYLDEHTITGWSFATFLKWINSSPNELNLVQIAFLKEQTEFMDHRTKDY